MEENHVKFEVSQITDNIFLGTNLCCLDRSHLQILTDMGITAEIDLEKKRQHAAPDIDVYLWLSVVDRTAPTFSQMEAGVSMIDTMVKEGKKIYIHCKNGHGRSPTIVASYFVSLGKSVAEAVEMIKSKRPEIHIEEVQLAGLEDYLKKIRS